MKEYAKRRVYIVGGVTKPDGYEVQPNSRITVLQVIAAVRRIHGTVWGVTADGTTYSADDPHLLRWIHVAEVESFLTTYQHYGRRRLTQHQADTYVAQPARAEADADSVGLR